MSVNPGPRPHTGMTAFGHLGMSEGETGISSPTPTPTPTSPSPWTGRGPGGEVALLDPGLNLTLRPMAYPEFYERYKAAIKNTWTVEEIDFSTDVTDLRSKLTDGERHLIQRLVAFFATGDSIVANNLVLN